MPAPAIQFSDGDAYERFMGRVAPIFLDWLQPRPHARTAQSVTGIDASAAQIAAAGSGRAAERARFHAADAMDLPFPDRCFDYAVCALVLNFIADPARALAEMRRVTAPGGWVGGYVWDFQSELSPSGPLRQAMRAFGAVVPALPGAVHSSARALESLFRRAGLSAVEIRTIDVTLAYSDFADFWAAQTPEYSPTTKIIDAMTEAERRRLMRAVQEAVPRGHNGKIEYTARANAVRGATAW